jgi:hypothetical protein
VLPELRGSRQMLLYLFQNILDNIIQLQHEGTAVNIRITCTKLPVTEDTNITNREKEYYCIAFTGKGINFEGEHREHRDFTAISIPAHQSIMFLKIG